MVLTSISLAAIVTALALFTSETGAQKSSIVPCVIGNGVKDLCESCDESKAIEVTSWDKATWVKDFVMEDAPAEDGLGYNVFWKIQKPAPNCRIVLMDSFSTEGSAVPNLTGRIRLSVNQGGCYFAAIRSGGVGVGACCGDECTKIGAFPDHATKKRDLAPREDTKPPIHPHYGLSLSQRDGGGRNPNPWAGKPADNKSEWNCKASPKGHTYNKLGKQILDGTAYLCSDIGCDMSVSFEASASTSLSSEKSTTFTNSQGTSVEMSVGVFFVAGPTANFAVGFNAEWSKAVAESMGTSETKSNSKSVSFRRNVKTGFQYNAWWAPKLECQKWTVSCDKGEGQMEKCEPILDKESKVPLGESGIMTTGLA